MVVRHEFLNERTNSFLYLVDTSSHNYICKYDHNDRGEIYITLRRLAFGSLPQSQQEGRKHCTQQAKNFCIFVLCVLVEISNEESIVVLKIGGNIITCNIKSIYYLNPPTLISQPQAQPPNHRSLICEKWVHSMKLWPQEYGTYPMFH